MLTEIRKYMPSFLQKLYQRRLLDKTAVISEEEFLEADRELAEEIKYVEYRLDILRDCHKMLGKLIGKKDLMG